MTGGPVSSTERGASRAVEPIRARTPARPRPGEQHASGQGNSLAWVARTVGEPAASALPEARRAPSRGDPAALNTLAAVLAEADRPVEARAAQARALEGDVPLDAGPGPATPVGRRMAILGIPTAPASATRP